MSGVFSIPLEKLRSAYLRADNDTGSPRLNLFVGGDENRLVRLAANAFLAPNDPTTDTDETNLSRSFNPLVLYGPTSTGKTHLALGLAARWKHAEPRRSLLAVTGADFARAYATALETDTLEDFRKKFRQPSCFVLDGLDEIADKLPAQQELASTLDELVPADSRVIITSRTLPFGSTRLYSPLSSRLSCGLTVPMLPPGPDARRHILTHLSKLHGLALSDEIMDLMSGLTDDSSPFPTVPSLNQAVIQLRSIAPHALSTISVDAVRKLFPLNPSRGQLTLGVINSAVAKYFGVRTVDLKSPSRRQLVVRARGVAVYLARQLTNESLDTIGRQYSGRDHTTVLHASRKTELLLETDPVIQKAVRDLTHQLNLEVRPVP